MEAITLSATNDKMPQVGFGTWKIPKEVCKDVVFQAIKKGYRLFDCAPTYANEVEVGQGIKEAIDQGIVKRSELFIVSKLFSTHHRKEHVKLGIERTLSDLGLEYLDLYLIHAPIALKHVSFEERYPPSHYYDTAKKIIVVDQVPLHETWAAMEQLVHSGLARNIGISNINASLLMDLLSYAKIKPSVLQMELHPYLTRKKLVNYAKSKDIAITAYSSFGDTSYHSMGVFDKSSGFVPLLENRTILDIAKNHSVTAAQVLIRWAVQQNIAVIPKSTNAERMSLNMQVYNFVLGDEEIKSIDDLNKDMRFVDPDFYLEGYPFYAN
ncbi:4-dihydromethyl-trisporate dehydrogenase [Smittium culicis]|uniref:4-dihydromethyl-trisporate dehydrogenase n=1 Tax=Smittium culicis TaxID=133412 RepID=A0A1R1YFF8_9FUNG|nr:4-dihydromethyl-trisporate dehydrogenase [Smittium culicis]